MFNQKFDVITEATARLYKIADLADLCGNESMKKDVNYALDRLIAELQEELSALTEEHGVGS